MNQGSRSLRRVAGMLMARTRELRLDEVHDVRKGQGKRWSLPVMLTTLLMGIMAGCRSLADLETLTSELTRAMRRRLRVPRRVPDTTLRQVACKVDPGQIRAVLHRQTRAGYRRKALMPERMPFGILALDGKTTMLPSVDDHYAQRQTQEGARISGALRTMTCTLVTARAKPCVDAIPIPAVTNEMGHFLHCVRQLQEAYGSMDLFRMVSTDAGSCSEENGRGVREMSLHYLFGRKGTQPTLLTEAQRILGDLPVEAAAARTTDDLGAGVVEERALFMTEQMAGFDGWTHLKTTLRVMRVRRRGNQVQFAEDRYFVSSLPACRLQASQWLRAIRMHWAVENNCHWTLDAIFREDDYPWIESDPKGALVLSLLRRVAYNMLALYRSVTLRSEQERAGPWRSLVRRVEKVLTMADELQLEGLRQRPLSAPS